MHDPPIIARFPNHQYHIANTHNHSSQSVVFTTKNPKQPSLGSIVNLPFSLPPPLQLYSQAWSGHFDSLLGTLSPSPSHDDSAPWIVCHCWEFEIHTLFVSSAARTSSTLHLLSTILNPCWLFVRTEFEIHPVEGSFSLHLLLTVWLPEAIVSTEIRINSWFVEAFRCSFSLQLLSAFWLRGLILCKDWVWNSNNLNYQNLVFPQIVSSLYLAYDWFDCQIACMYLYTSK